MLCKAIGTIAIHRISTVLKSRFQFPQQNLLGRLWQEILVQRKLDEECDFGAVRWVKSTFYQGFDMVPAQPHPWHPCAVTADASLR